MIKQILIIGGGTISHVRPHLALCAPAYGSTARILYRICQDEMPEMQSVLLLTKMADHLSAIETSADLERELDYRIERTPTKIIFMTAAVCDFDGYVLSAEGVTSPSGKNQPRLHSNTGHAARLSPAPKLIQSIRRTRKDVFLVGCKTTAGMTEDQMYIAGLKLCKEASCNLVLVNDIHTRMNMIITPEEARYHVTSNRGEVLVKLVEMAKLRSQMTFTRSTVVAGDPVPWGSSLIPASLRRVVNFCISCGAYKPFAGATVGHFACKIGPKTFLTSRRKTDFNKINELGLVKIETDGPDTVLAYGFKPSVGGQSQRIVFDDHPEYDCIVHFHCPISDMTLTGIPVISQREYECGSHECGKNTSAGLKKFGNLSAVYLDQHGPNIVFHSSIDPWEVILFIQNNFDLTSKTGGSVDALEIDRFARTIHPNAAKS